MWAPCRPRFCSTHLLRSSLKLVPVGSGNDQRPLMVSASGLDMSNSSRNILKIVLFLGALLWVLGASLPASAQDDPATTGLLDHAPDIAEPVTDIVDPVGEPVVDPVADVVEPIAEPLTTVVEPVTTVIEPVVEPVVEPVANVIEPVADPVDSVTEPVIAPVIDAAEPAVEPVVSAVEPESSVVQPVSEITQPGVAPVSNQANDDSTTLETDRSLTDISGAITSALGAELPLSIATPPTVNAAFRTYIDRSAGDVSSRLAVVTQRLPASIVLDPLLGAEGQQGVTESLLAAIRLDDASGTAVAPVAELLSNVDLANPVGDVTDQAVNFVAVVTGPALAAVQRTTTAVIDTTTTLEPVADLILHVDVADPVGDASDQLMGSVADVTGSASTTVQSTTKAVIETLRPTLDALDLTRYVPDPADSDDPKPLPVTDTIDITGPVAQPVMPIAPLNPNVGPDTGAPVGDVADIDPLGTTVKAEPVRPGNDFASDTNDSIRVGFGAMSRVCRSHRPLPRPQSSPASAPRSLRSDRSHRRRRFRIVCQT